MPSISITFPTASDPVGANFTAYGKLSLDFVVDHEETERTGGGRVSVECWAEKGGTRYDSAESNNTESWQADFTGVPPGPGYSIHAVLHIDDKTFEAPPVSNLEVVTTDVGGVGLRGSDADRGREAGVGDPDRKSYGSGKDGGRKAAPLKRVPVHHQVSAALTEAALLRIRSISAVYMVEGVQVTRVFTAEINPLDGDFHLKMDLRRAAGIGRPGSIFMRIDSWPNRVAFQSIPNLIVTDE